MGGGGGVSWKLLSKQSLSQSFLHLGGHVLIFNLVDFVIQSGVCCSRVLIIRTVVLLTFNKIMHTC